MIFLRLDARDLRLDWALGRYFANVSFILIPFVGTHSSYGLLGLNKTIASGCSWT